MSEALSANRLAAETSPYLLQHAGNPVAWYPWGEAALEKARQEDKPILLSIGYSACHWCHVMAHESFEDPQIAALMNEHFVNIKVDREERPDLDKIYQLAHQLLTGRPGGWPLTLFLTPDQLPFFGGTYFPPEPRHGMPGFPELLERIAETYRDNGAAIAEQNQSMQQALTQLAAPPQAEQMHADPIRAARQALASSFDSQFGGFGQAPKFPQPVALNLLLRHYARSVDATDADREALHMVCTTLRRMALGGIYDQVGGGFARYAVDRHWMIPHFEKMLYDNGLLLGLYADAWHATGDMLFARVARETGQWLCEHMRSEEGGFFAALDADSEGEEGRYYLWDREEIEALLPKAEQELVIRRFGLDEPPNFEGRWHFHVHASFSELAKALRQPRSEVVALWESARQRLQAQRQQRIPPQRDEKIITAWNALAISGLARAGRLLDEPALTDAAARAMDFVRQTLWRDGRLVSTYKDDRPGNSGYLDDYAYVLEACLETLQARWSQALLDFARDNAEVLLAHFEDETHGGFFFTADDHENLVQRPRPLMDDALPAGNGVAALALNRLGHLTSEPRYTRAAERALQAADGAIHTAPQAHCALLSARDEIENGVEQVVCRGRETPVGPLREAASRYYVPFRMVFTLPPDAEPPTGLTPAEATHADASAWVCAGHRCLPPTTDSAELTEQLRVTRGTG